MGAKAVRERGMLRATLPRLAVDGTRADRRKLSRVLQRNAAPLGTRGEERYPEMVEQQMLGMAHDLRRQIVELCPGDESGQRACLIHGAILS